MNIDGREPFYSARGVALPTPASFRALPKLTVPDQEQVQAAADLERSFTRQSGILPGTYTKFVDIKALINVHDNMWDTLEGELLKFDNLAICEHLYQKLEVIWGHLHINRYRTAADQTLTGRTQGSENDRDIWRAITPTTEGIKFLLEMAIRTCGDRGWISGSSRLDFLISLSSRIVMLDQHLDNIFNDIVPYEIIITPDFSIDGRIADQATVAFDNFQKSEKPHSIQANRDFIDSLNRVMGPKIKIDDFHDFPGFVQLDKAMMQELGYGIFDWMSYAKGCITLFAEEEYFKKISVSKFTKYLKTEVGLDSAKLELLLQDHALSQATVKDLTRDDMMPIENYRRDSRILRRPLLVISHGGARIVLVGIETLVVGLQVFFESVEYGTLQISRMQPRGPIKAAIGILQSQIGAPFRDSIASKCIAMGFKAETEWAIPKKDGTDKPVGPIDILVIDQKKRRFILVEAKNLQSQGLVPKEMKVQRSRFLGAKGRDDQAFIQVLKDKEQAFASNKQWHLQKLRMDGAEDYSIESVIVVFHPLFWPLVASEPLAILDDLEFYNRLHLGQHFLTTPIVI